MDRSEIGKNSRELNGEYRLKVAAYDHYPSGSFDKVQLT